MKKRDKIIIAIVVVVGFSLAAYFYSKEDGLPEVLTENQLDISEPAREDYTYKHEKGFTVLVPRGWRIAERDDAQNLEVILYPADLGQKVPEAFDTRPHVSIFPFGTGSGSALPWASATSAVALNTNDGAQVQQFVTQENVPWGWSVTFANPPKGTAWRSWGTVFASLDMIEKDPICADKAGTTKDELECNQLQGDVLYRTGRIDKTTETTILRILKSVDIQ